MKKFAMFFAAVSLFPVFAVELNDPAFAKNKDGVLAAWKNVNKSTVKVENGVLTITAVKAKLWDSIFQGQRITPSDAQYVFSVDVDAPVAKSAFVQIKMFSKNKELMRASSPAAVQGKSRLFVVASHPNADIIEVAMRVNHAGAGKEFKFSNPVLKIAEEGALFGTWIRGGKGFSVSDITDDSFTITIDSAEKYHSSMGISRNVEPGKKFVFEADYKCDAARMAYLEVKYYKGNKELKRKQAYSDSTSGKLSVEVNTDGCDKLILQCRVPAAAKYVGKKAVFSNFKFKEVK